MGKILAAALALSALFGAAAPDFADASEKYETYFNARFGYSMEYPDIFETRKEPENGDGVKLASKNGEYTLAIWGGYNVLGQDGTALLEESKERVAHVVPDSERSAGRYYSIQYSDDGGKDGVEHIFYEYVIVNSAMKAGFTFSYPKDEEMRFAVTVIDMENSLKMPEDETSETEGFNPGVFSLKDGRVFKGDEELDCEVNDVPKEIEGPIRHWSVIGTGTSDVVKENETGVWFFASGGEFLAFAPLENENECQDIVFSPDGASLVLVTGSGMRPDMFFEVYGEGMEMIAGFSGIRGALAWIDSARFVFTAIGDIREGRFANLGYGLRFSVSMYDVPARQLIVLKEATETQNYSLWEVIEDGNAVTVIEESVKSEKDWGDEEKTETREIRVEIPAAG
ncbi:MAG: hypothetical protein LBS00_11250 [Synergistaceae bacterium]|nr:hypothetical protein [Synergistaceae bacterium]